MHVNCEVCLNGDAHSLRPKPHMCDLWPANNNTSSRDSINFVWPCPEIKGHAIETGRMTCKNYFVHRINGRIVCSWYNLVFIKAITNVSPGSYSSLLPLSIGMFFTYTYHCKNPTFPHLKTTTYWPSLRHYVQCRHKKSINFLWATATILSD